MTRREVQLFGALFDNDGTILSPNELAALAWDRAGDSRSMISIYMSSLRKKLALFGDRFGVRTVRGAGYRFEVPR